MLDTDRLKAEIKKLSAQAMQAKMDLHDLSEELPIGWSQIPAVAQRAHDTFELLESKREQLKAKLELVAADSGR
ncbi:MAG: CCE_0567 family metalloprotein [Vulcanimicrobiaceae bacterium]